MFMFIITLEQKTQKIFISWQLEHFIFLTFRNNPSSEMTQMAELLDICTFVVPNTLFY